MNMMDDVYKISSFAGIMKTELCNHSRIGHLFSNINDICFMAMMSHLFQSLYTYNFMDSSIDSIHKHLHLTSENFVDWIECFHNACEKSNISCDDPFRIKVLNNIKHMQNLMHVDKMFDNIIFKSKNNLPIENDIEKVKSMWHKRIMCEAGFEPAMG